MKTIGLIGGMSWESTAEYYRLINQGIKEKLGGFHSARLILYSVDFSEIEMLQRQGDWQGTADILSEAAVKIEAAGADFFLICTNTMHKVAPQVQQRVSIECLHIADATGNILHELGVGKVGLLGTSFTMEQDFYKGKLKNDYNLDVIVPSGKDRSVIHDTIFQELCLGISKEQSRNEFIRIIQTLQGEGAEAVILGCTEIGLLVSQGDLEIPVIDTTAVHAMQAVELAT